LSGYTERLIRKAEHGGSLDMSTILDLAETLSTPEYRVPLELITIDIVSIAKKWVESFDKLHRKMLPEIEAYLADDFVFNCPGDPAMAPFVGVWERREGLQKWLDTFFDFFEENRKYRAGVSGRRKSGPCPLGGPLQTEGAAVCSGADQHAFSLCRRADFSYR
jgi:hypothetical protein